MDFNIEPKSKVKTLLAAAGFCLVVVIVAFTYLFGFAPFPEKSLPDRIIFAYKGRFGWTYSLSDQHRN